VIKICSGYDENNKSFPPLNKCKWDDVKKRWYTEHHTIEELINIFPDCIISAPGGELEYGNGTWKKWKEDFVFIIYNSFFEI
jgi:hypothetical protein